MLCPEHRDVEIWVWDAEWLPDFVDRLAAGYRGWSGERVWSCGRLAVRATFHSRGYVELAWELWPWESYCAPWRLSISSWLEAGSRCAASPPTCASSCPGRPSPENGPAETPGAGLRPAGGSGAVTARGGRADGSSETRHPHPAQDNPSSPAGFVSPRPVQPCRLDHFR